MAQFIRYADKRSVNISHLFEVGFSKRSRTNGDEDRWYLMLYEGVKKKSAVMMFCVRDQSRDGAENLFLKILESNERVIDIRADVLSAEEEFELLQEEIRKAGIDLSLDADANVKYNN